MILGHGILELAWIMALLTGLAPFFRREDVFIIIALAGGGILLWMAVSMFKSLPGLSLDMDVRDETPKNLILAGIVIGPFGLDIHNPVFLVSGAAVVAFVFYTLALPEQAASIFSQLTAEPASEVVQPTPNSSMTEVPSALYRVRVSTLLPMPLPMLLQFACLICL